MACGWLAAASVPAMAGGRTPAPVPDEAVAECALAAPIVAAQPSGGIRGALESLFAADACFGRLAAFEGATPLQGPAGHGCADRAEALADAEAGLIESGLRVALHRRVCVEGASPREWAARRTRTPD